MKEPRLSKGEYVISLDDLRYKRVHGISRVERRAILDAMTREAAEDDGFARYNGIVSTRDES